MAGERWLFSQEQLANTPSRKAGIDNDKEVYYRQQAANFIQDMGQRLQVTQLCINTAIVYLHRFYMFHGFTKFHRNNMAEACLFLAAKVEEQPRKLEHIIKMAHTILHRDQGPLDTKSVAYLEHAQELVVNENILLQSLGFELQVDHPHTHIVKTCNLIRAAKDLAQTSYFLATNSLHLTQMCLQYKPTVVACVCIHLACKWAQFEIPRSSEGKEWFFYVDKTMTTEILEELTQNFLAILDKCPSKFKKKLMSKSAKDEDLLNMMAERRIKTEPTATVTSEQEGASTSGTNPSTRPLTNHDVTVKQEKSEPLSAFQSASLGTKTEKTDNPTVKVEPKLSDPPFATGGLRRVKTEGSLTMTPKEYLERKERERLERERIERERLQMIHAKEKASQQLHSKTKDSAQPTEREGKDKTKPTTASTSQGRQHMNIFEQMASSQPGKTEASSSASEAPSAGTSSLLQREPPPKENHSRPHSQHINKEYKDKYHEKEAAGSGTVAPSSQSTRKLPFSVDMNKLRDDRKQSSSSSHKHSTDRRGTSDFPRESSSRHGYESKHKMAHPSHTSLTSEHRVSEHRSRAPSSMSSSKYEAPPRGENPQPATKPSATAPPQPSRSEPKVSAVAAVDPEEGEIIDDDSPPAEEPKKSHSSSYHQHHYHHRERRSSGHRHHSPGAATAAVPSGDKEAPSGVATTADGRTRRRSPRNGRPPKDETSAGHNTTSADHKQPTHEHKQQNYDHKHSTVSAASITSSKLDLSMDPVLQLKPLDLDSLPTKVPETHAASQHATPEPGEIVERSSHKHHHHHKSSHSKSHKKDKHRDRDRERDSSGGSDNHQQPHSGSLKIKLDLKSMGKMSSTPPTKHSSPGSASFVASGSTPGPGGTPSDERQRRELKLKIKSLSGSDASFSSADGAREGGDSTLGGSESRSNYKQRPTDPKNKDAALSSSRLKDGHKESPPNLKMKLKLGAATGNGETHGGSSLSAGSGGAGSGSSKRASHDSLSNPIKLVLSKDSLGQYTHTSPGPTSSQSASALSSSHKHKHSSGSSSDKPSSRKRPFSPSEPGGLGSGGPHRHKLARNDSSGSLAGKRAGTATTPNSHSGSPFLPPGGGTTGTPTKEFLDQCISNVQQLIDLTQGQIQGQRGSSSGPAGGTLASSSSSSTSHSSGHKKHR